MKFSKIIILTLSLAFALAMFNGCDKSNPVATSPALEQSNDAPHYTILRSKYASLNKLFVQTKKITSKGGKIEVGEDKYGKSLLEFPQNAVSGNVDVTFEWESSGLLMGGATFSPHGTQFLQPVYIRLSFKDADLGGINPANLKLLYYNEDTGVWELISDNVNLDGQYIEGYINHFSRYAIGTE